MSIRRAESITYVDIDAYQRVTGVQLSGVEIDAIFAMDNGASRAIMKIRKEETK